MPVIEAQCASILVPHDHRHINHVRICVVRPLVMQSTCPGVVTTDPVSGGKPVGPAAAGMCCSMAGGGRPWARQLVGLSR